MAAPFPLSDRASDVRPGCKTQRIAPTLRQVADLVCARIKDREYFKTFDIPDPYVILSLAKAPHSWRKTSVKDNDVNPKWNETFKFYVDPDQEHTLEMSLMDANYTMDEHLATRSLLLNPLPIGQKRNELIRFNETSEVLVEVSAENCEKPDLRYSLMLCQEEKDFIDLRKRRIHKAMKSHFGFASPRNYKEVPVIAVIGSGGGFRAMTAYSGAFSALAQLGVLDMTTYVAGLSGSACNSIISIEMRKRAIQCYIEPVLMYGCEAWTISKQIQNKPEATELWFLRRMLRIPWTAKKTNERVLNEANKRRSLVRTIRKRQATFLGHVMKRGKLEHLVTTGKFEGKRSRGRQRENIMDGLAIWLGPGNISQINWPLSKIGICGGT
ncbi:phospholipase a2 [Plakobranchus ocellatus]|uniref:Phospholipase A2 n=1 Tax=Plakobranchus ocellatus TaxID=259542 RepID=A0AAV4DZH3_9GAST|nr:phospholipase a2 [Plakobranchus ocellatus]